MGENPCQPGFDEIRNGCGPRDGERGIKGIKGSFLFLDAV
jgi:hypothetical protein